MARAKPIISAGLMIACLGLLVLGGRKAGQQIARSGIIDRLPIKAESAPPSAGRQPRVREENLRADPDRVAAAIKRLQAASNRSQYPTMDWEAIAEIDAVIAKLNTAELAEVFAGLDQSSHPNRDSLMSKVGAAWMAKDPDAALKAALALSANGRGYLAQRMFSGWAADDPKTALAWLDSAAIPENPPGLRDEMRGAVLSGLIERDFEFATAEFLKMNPDYDHDHGYRNPMSSWGSLYADDPAMRGRLLEFAKTTGRPADYGELNSSLIRYWPQEDVIGTIDHLQALKGYLESGSIPADARTDVDGSAVAAAIHREYDRPALEWWMERYGDSRDTPAAMREAMAGWARKYPEKMLQWFQEQPPSPQRDALTSSVIPSLATSGKYTEAADSIATIEDANYRQAATERLDLIWSESDPAAAEAWRAGLEGGE